TFEFTHRGLSSMTVGTRAPHPANLWSWNGPGGIRQGLLQSFVTFGAIKGAGRLASGENLVAQHLLQDSAMVLGHNISANFGITPRPAGTLAEQFLLAEATNLQIGAGMALAHRMVPGMHAMERGLDLSLSIPPAEPFQGREAEKPGRAPAFALEGVESAFFEPHSIDPISGPLIMQMAGPKGRRGRGSSKEPSRSAATSLSASTVSE